MIIDAAFFDVFTPIAKSIKGTDVNTYIQAEEKNGNKILTVVIEGPTSTLTYETKFTTNGKVEKKSVIIDTDKFLRALGATWTLNRQLNFGPATLTISSMSRDIVLATQPATLPRVDEIHDITISSDTKKVRNELEAAIESHIAICRPTGIIVMGSENTISVDSRNQHMICLTDPLSKSCIKDKIQIGNKDQAISWGMLGSDLKTLHQFLATLPNGLKISAIVNNNKIVAIEYTDSTPLLTTYRLRHKILDPSIYSKLNSVAKLADGYKSEATVKLDPLVFKDCCASAPIGEDERSADVCFDNIGDRDRAIIKTTTGTFRDVIAVESTCQFDIKFKSSDISDIAKIGAKHITDKEPLMSIGLNNTQKALYFDFGTKEKKTKYFAACLSGTYVVRPYSEGITEKNESRAKEDAEVS
jgi:hypothetical protein